MSKRIDNQNKEFDAVAELAKQYRRITLTPPVDDDYPEVRHAYESAVRQFIEAYNNNRPQMKINIISEPSSVELYQSMPHVSRINYSRALRWHPAGLNAWSMSDWFTALAGEVGEAGNVIKKMNRVRDGMQQRGVDNDTLKEKLKMEIGDIYIYLDLLGTSR